MSHKRQMHGFRQRLKRAASVVFLAAFALVPVACSRKAAPQPQARRYHLVGKVVSIDQQKASIVVDGQEIVGFMGAMTMPYSVRDAKSLAALGPGDEISADLIVTDDGANLDNIVVTKKGSGSGRPSGTSHTPAPGDKVPDFALVNQDGKQIRLRSIQGDVLLVTFIYTRCPFPDYCPLVSKNFSRIDAALQKNLALRTRIRLLSVSFDPAHDTPAVLRRYARTFRPATGSDSFGRWEFAVVPPKELPDVANFFGLYYKSESGQITHSMSTTVISPAGNVYKWYDDNAWAPADILGDAAQVLRHDNQRDAASHASSSVPAF
ncbi:MAG TPA: SCO family protein [Candidatus Acidoferrales bacterium]|nr:SCO family protein [Candidatus Acidoferrales bacterium]